MLDTYKNWIDNHYPTKQSAYRACEEATINMSLSFPELKRVCGLASVEELYGDPPTKTPHWWLKDKNGNIVDPTGHQYPTRILKYEEASEDCGPPTGRCPNCGDLCYEGHYLCSDKCSKEYMKYLNNSKCDITEDEY